MSYDWSSEFFFMKDLTSIYPDLEGNQSAILGINKCNMLMAKPSLLLLPAINVFQQPNSLTFFCFKPG